MKFNDWLSQGYGRVTQTARALNVPVSFVSKINNGRKGIPAEHCPAIEELTGGEVRCEEMRPDVKWHVLRNSARPLGASEPFAEVKVIAAPEAANDVALDAPGRA